ncbi:MAG: hypothetical protein M3Z20_09610 [Chloroflexota bacterium]|nr:hypothetical protein [Chloroflexota bacterium]
MKGEASVWQGWGSDLLVVSVTSLVLVLVGVLIWQLFKTYQTKLAVDAHVAQEAAYRALAEQSARAQEHAAEQLSLVHENVAQLNTRVSSIERLLKDVE